MTFAHLEVAVDGPVGTIWLNRPEKHNALSEDMWADLPVAVRELDRDPSVRVMVVAGRGPSFSVGIDLGMLAGLTPPGRSEAERRQALRAKIKELQATMSAMADCRKPVVAAIHGYCLGAGMDLITACDLRLAAAGAVFSVRETRMGLVADVGTLQRLPRIVTAGHVAELVFTGADIDAARAAEIGLVNRVLPGQDQLMKATRELAEAIAANSPLVVEGIKTVLRAGADQTVEEGLDYVALWNSAYLLSDDLNEAITAHLEKRPPDFRGH